MEVGESILFSGSSNSTNDQNGRWPSACPGDRLGLPVSVSSFLLSFFTSFPVFLPLFLPPDLHVEWGGYLGEMVLTELDWPLGTWHLSPALIARATPPHSLNNV